MQLGYDPVRMTSVERYCTCKEQDCRCGEDNEHEWEWDQELDSRTSKLSEGNKEVTFHAGYSTGTAAVRGNRPMAKGRHHYWEVKMITPVYGTDVMVGVGTRKVDLDASKLIFCSLLGRDKESWGFSYRGHLQYGGETRSYAQPFGQGSLVGVYLDTWKGTLQFFLNRKPLGIAFTGLRGLELYPMLSSTAAQSKVRITHSSSVPASLQLACLTALRPTLRASLSSTFPGLCHLTKSIFADILQSSYDEDEDDDGLFEDCTILDDFDAALVGCKRKKRERSEDTLNTSRVARCMCENCGAITTVVSTSPLCVICRCI